MPSSIQIFRFLVHMNFNYGQLSDKDTLLNFDNTVVPKELFPLLEIRKLALQDGPLVVRVLQGSEGKESVNSQQHVAFGVTGLSLLGSVWCVMYKPAVRLSKGL